VTEADDDLQAQMVAMNEALILGSLRQHELTEAAEALNAQLRTEMEARSLLERKAQAQAATLAEVDRNKDEFLAMLSHELRSPLAAISNATELLRLEKNEGPLQLRARQIIERKVGHLTHLVQDMLDVSRITSGKVQLRLQPIDLGSVVEGALEISRPLLDQHQHELTVSLPSEPILVHADGARLEQVVVNLLTNAAKYSDDAGHISLTVQQEDGWAVLRVQDRGVGIAPELLPHIFDLFTQAERSLDRSEGGLGIGLYVVQRMVQLHGGSVEVSSVMEQGTEFVVRLPVESAPILPSSIPATETAQPTARVCRVLVVDDDEDTAEGLAMLLTQAGHDVRIAHDGPAAVEAALDYRPDVVLTDIGLPMLNGYEVAQRLRQHAELRGTMLVAITGYGQERDRARTGEAGFDYHLLKPADFREVQKILATVMERATTSS
jgi:signal transduction histidine kinase/ActR/RegA family two-component response regulator